MPRAACGRRALARMMLARSRRTLLFAPLRISSIGRDADFIIFVQYLECMRKLHTHIRAPPQKPSRRYPILSISSTFPVNQPLQTVHLLPRLLTHAAPHRRRRHHSAGTFHAILRSNQRPRRSRITSNQRPASIRVHEMLLTTSCCRRSQVSYGDPSVDPQAEASMESYLCPRLAGNLEDCRSRSD